LIRGQNKSAAGEANDAKKRRTNGTITVIPITFIVPFEKAPEPLNLWRGSAVETQ
jgi:hypothetical protein